MVRSAARTVDEYLKELPVGRRADFQVVLEVVRKNMPAGYEEAMNWGMVCWQVPLSIRPETYNKQPLMFAALANQKNYISLYMMGVFTVPALYEKLMSSEKKIRMGRGCINFTKASSLPLDVIGEIISEVTVDKYLAEVDKRSGSKHD
jgi:hypothetical protein